MVDPRRVMAARDWMLWGVLSALVALENVAVGGYGAGWPWAVASVVVVGVAVRERRTRPLVAFVAAAGLTSVEIIQSASGDDSFKVMHSAILVLISYAVGRNSDRTRGFVTLVIAGDFALLAVGLPARGSVAMASAVLTWLWIVIASLVFVILPWLYGRYRAQHASLVSAGWARAEQMESEQRMAVDRARLRERNRIAQDMHDSLGHELSLIALRAGGMEVDRELSERHRQAAGELREAAAAATERLGDVVGVLRADDESALAPAVESVAEIVERAEASGVDATLETDDSDLELNPLARQAFARVVQEGLTNASKHAAGAAVTVRLRDRGDSVELRVHNGRPPTGAAEAVASGGHGLTGLDERLRLIGGELAHGEADSGFELVATVPRDVEIPGPREDAAGQESFTATEHDAVRRRARRGLRTAILAPIAVGCAIGAVMLAYYLVLGYLSVLDESDYEQLQIGQSREEADGLLPSVEMIDTPTGPPTDDGVACEFYRSEGPLQGTFAYRVCFEGDVLTSKEKVAMGSASIEEEQ